MFLPDEYQHQIEDECSEQTRRKLNNMIGAALINNREELEIRSAHFTEEQALQMIAELSEQMPIMGLHSIPHQLYDQKEAIKYMIDKDELHEQRFKK